MFLMETVATSRSSGKSTYATRLKFFDDGDGSHSDFVVETFLAYLLLWYVLPSGPEDGLNLIYTHW